VTDILGLLLSVSLGLLGMCLMVMACSFLATIIVTNNSDSFDTEDIIGDIEEVNDVKDNENEENVYMIDNANYLNKYHSFDHHLKYFPFVKQHSTSDS
jgi:hypothetical protein